MIGFLQEILFERGMMPAVSLVTGLIALIAVISFRPTSPTTYCAILSACTIPLFAGIAGTISGYDGMIEGIEYFLSTEPSAEQMSEAREHISYARRLVWEPFFVGLAAAILPASIATVLFVARPRKGSEPENGGDA